MIDGSPTAATVNAFLLASPNNKAAFGVKPVYFALEQLGGGHSTGAAGSQTTYANTELTVNLSKLAVKQDLIVALAGPQQSGAGFTNLYFNITANGVTLVSQNFTSVLAATTYFIDHPLDLGSLASGPLNAGGTLVLDIAMDVTTASAGDSFSVTLLVGDPPPVAAGPTALASAMAAFGAPSGGSALAAAPAASHALASLPQLAAPALA